MSMFLGNMVLAGDVGRAINAARKAGGGAAGWEAAREYLRVRHPDAPTVSINAVVERARQTSDVARRYRTAGPNYRVDKSLVPDLRRSISERLQSTQLPPDFTGESKYVHHVRVTVRDASQGNAAISTFVETIKSDSILSKAELERAANRAADDYLDRFVRYKPSIPARSSLTASYSFEGIYRGY